jgi:Asp-tRNA(Asn)/Glu-tRNA(Gln) amidotransferase A subunit family amidase
MSAADDLCFLSAVDLAAAIRARTVSPLDAFEAVARRIETVNPAINAYCTLALDEARDQARAATEALTRRADLGPLHGVPVAVKDDLPVRGLRWTSGSLLWAERVAEIDDLTVSRLRAAGAVILGKTNLPENGHKGTTENRLFGTTANPWDRSRTAGGSSGGSGAAVAAGLAYLALGTDIGGSIRIPASCCGIVGLKPTFGLVPRVPAGNAFVPFWGAGPMGRTVAEVALGLRVLAGPDDRDPFALPAAADDFGAGGSLAGVRVGWCPSPTGAPVESGVAAAAEAALRALAASGAAVEPLRSPPPVAPREAMYAMFRSLCLAEIGAGSADEFARVRRYLSETFAAFVDPGLSVTPADHFMAQVAATEYVARAAGCWFESHDLLATPTLAVPPFSKDLPLGPGVVAGEPVDPHLGWAFTWPFNLTHQPAVSVPCGWTADGLPLGLQLVGRRGADGLVLRAAAAVEAAAPRPPRRPPL